MAIKLITKAKEQIKKKVVTRVAAKSKQKNPLVDQYANLLEEEKGLKKSLSELGKEIAGLQTELLSECDLSNPEEPATLLGVGYILQVSEQSLVSTLEGKSQAVDMLSKISEDLPLELARFTLTDLKKYLTEAQYNKVVAIERTGSRKVKVLKRGGGYV